MAYDLFVFLSSCDAIITSENIDHFISEPSFTTANTFAQYFLFTVPFDGTKACSYPLLDMVNTLSVFNFMSRIGI